MVGGDAAVLVVLAADRSLFQRVADLRDSMVARFGRVQLEWMPDPMQLAHARTCMSERLSLGAVLDLTALETMLPAGRAAQQESVMLPRLDDASFAWRISAMLAVFGSDDRIPVLIGE